MNSLLGILVALCGAELIHNTYEVWGVRHKLAWLKLLLDGKQPGRWPFNIDNTFKIISLHTAILVIFTGVFYLVFSILGLSNISLVRLGIVVLLTNYSFTTWHVHKYHCEVGTLIAKVKK